MTIWLQAMAEAASRAHQAWNWWGASSSWNTASSTYSQIAQAVSENQCWKDHCKQPEIEPLGLCKQHLEEMKRESLEAP